MKPEGRQIHKSLKVTKTCRPYSETLINFSSELNFSCKIIVTALKTLKSKQMTWREKMKRSS